LINLSHFQIPPGCLSRELQTILAGAESHFASIKSDFESILKSTVDAESTLATIQFNFR
jgi:hypothetical protein